jgi:predicted GNAT family acetyltransferase
MKIQLEQKGTHYAFFIEEEGERLAEMVFKQAGPDKIIIEHTEVDDKLRGTGAGKKLVAEAVAYARRNNLKIVPLCSFTKSVIDKTKEYQDVLF